MTLAVAKECPIIVSIMKEGTWEWCNAWHCMCMCS